MKKRKLEIFKEKGIVRKYYFNSEDLQKELYIYSKQSGITPKLVDHKHNWLEFEYIEAVNLWNIEKPDFAEIGRLYAHLHCLENRNGKVICHVDSNPQNILYSKKGDHYYLIDFVDWRWDSPTFDIIHFLLFWIYALEYSTYKKTVNDFIQGYHEIYGLDFIYWKKDFEKAKNYFDKRRREFNKKESDSAESEKNLLYLKEFTI